MYDIDAQKNPWDLFEETLRAWFKKHYWTRGLLPQHPQRVSLALCAADMTMMCVNNTEMGCVHPVFCDLSQIRQDDWSSGWLFSFAGNSEGVRLPELKACASTFGVHLLKDLRSDLRYVRMQIPGTELLTALRKANPSMHFELLPFGNLQCMAHLDSRMTWEMVAALFAAHAFERGPGPVINFLQNMQ